MLTINIRNHVIFFYRVSLFYQCQPLICRSIITRIVLFLFYTHHSRQQILESFNNVNLDPNSPNYISKVIGDQTQTVGTDGTTKYLALSGDYPNKSRFIRVKSVDRQTIDYLDEKI